MYAAELGGKLSSELAEAEDVLTSNVFGFFEYADRTIYLSGYLRRLGFDVSDDEARLATFDFWPRYSDGTEPDLVIRVGDLYLLFEAKYRSGFGINAEDPSQNQIRRELAEGSAEAAVFDGGCRLNKRVLNHSFFTAGCSRQLEFDIGDTVLAGKARRLEFMKDDIGVFFPREFP